MRARFPRADAVVFGHSHLPLHEEEDGFQIFNPAARPSAAARPALDGGAADRVGPPVFEHVWL